MNIRDRLMSRASVAAMAAFAPKPEGAADTSKVGQPERVEDAGADQGGGDDLGLTAEEQAQFDAMQAGRVPGEPGSREDIEADGGSDAGEVEASGEDDAGDTGDAGEADAAADAAPDAAAADAKPAPKTISYGKYQREQQKQQKRFDDLQKQLDAARGETAKEREARTRLDERTKLLLEAIQTKAPAAADAKQDDDPEPDGEADPIGHSQWKIRKLEKQVEGLTGATRQQQQVTAAEREERQVYEAYAGDLEAAARQDASFADAFVHLRETRYRELGFIYAGIDINDQAQCAQLSAQEQKALSDNIQRTFHNEQMMVAREAVKVGKRPAEVVRNLALARGFAPKAAAAADDGADDTAPAGKNGKAPAGRKAPPAVAGSVTDQLQAIREGQTAAKSLSDAGGSPGGSITPQRLAEMTDDEFMELYETMPKRKLDALMGKPPVS